MQQKNNSSILWKSETSFRKLRKFRYIIELFDAKCDIIWVIVNYVLNWKSRHRNRAKNEEGRAFKCTSFYLKQSCQAMQVVMQYYISRCNKAKKRNKEQAFKPGLYYWAIQTWWLSRMKSGDLAGRKSSAAAVTPPKSRASMGTLIHVSGSVLLGIGG